MEITEMIQEFIIPLTFLFCYALGMALKSTKKFKDEYIPIMLLVVGAVINPLATHEWTAEAIFIGGISGWASVGLHQTFKQLGKSE